MLNLMKTWVSTLKIVFSRVFLSPQAFSFSAFSLGLARSSFCIGNSENSEKSNHMLSATSNIELEFLTKFLNLSKLHNRCTRCSRYIIPGALGTTSLSCGEAVIENLAISALQFTGSSNW